MPFMNWFKLYADLKDHPKRWRFEELADTEYGLHYITAWFSYVCKFASDGNVTAFTPREVARACEWKGDPQKLWDALLGAGFIDVTEEGYQAHDWHEENGRFIRENDRRKKTQGLPTENPRVTQGLPVRQDKTGQDNTIHKPLAAGAELESGPAPKPKRKPKPEANLEGFEDFWALYPRKDAKLDAQKAWSEVPVDERPKIVEAVRWQIKSPLHLQKDDPTFIKLPAGWLRAKRWLDQKESGRSESKRLNTDGMTIEQIAKINW